MLARSGTASALQAEASQTPPTGLADDVLEERSSNAKYMVGRRILMHRSEVHGNELTRRLTGEIVHTYVEHSAWPS
jgi:hypothetical protein